MSTNQQNGEQRRADLRALVRGAYDVQALRIDMGQRLVSNFKARLGQGPGKKEEELDNKAKDFLSILRAEYRRLSDGHKHFPAAGHFEGTEIIANYTEFVLADQWVALESRERDHFAKLKRVVETFPLWGEFLEGIKGIGPAMAGVMLSEIDISKARYPSSLWKYAGLDVAEDGAGRSRREEHLILVEYTDKHGEKKTRRSITFNPWLKSKLFLLGDLFVKHRTPGYREIYDNYKNRLEHHERYGTHRDGEMDGRKMVTCPGRRHNMAIRYAVKMFLIDLYKAWRPLENLPVAPPFHEAKLGLKHASVDSGQAGRDGALPADDHRAATRTKTT
jgi:hypothetical protein